MKEIAWDDILSVDVEEIDEDHRKLLDIYNVLSRALTEGGSPDYIEAILEELVNGTIWHFSHEERLMVQYNYPEMEEHRAAHRELVESAREFQKRFLEGGRKISEQDLAFLEHWLTAHILTDDKRLGAFLAEAM